jgi:hypothetical protein
MADSEHQQQQRPFRGIDPVRGTVIERAIRDTYGILLAEEAIMDYLETHDTIKRADYQIKAVFNRVVKAGMIEQVPGTRTSNTTYRKKKQEHAHEATASH